MFLSIFVYCKCQVGQKTANAFSPLCKVAELYVNCAIGIIKHFGLELGLKTAIMGYIVLDTKVRGSKLWVLG